MAKIDKTEDWKTKFYLVKLITDATSVGVCQLPDVTYICIPRRQRRSVD